MSQPDQKTLVAEGERLNAEFAAHPWFRGSYWGVPIGHDDPATVPGWVVQVAAGHAEAELAVTAASRKLNLPGPALRVVIQTDNPRAYAG